MCACSLIALAIGVSGSLGTSWTTVETMDLMNGYETLRGTTEDSAGNKLDVFENAPQCMKLIAMTFMAHCVPINAAAFILVYDDLPICVLPIMIKLGLIPDNVWHLKHLSPYKNLRAGIPHLPKDHLICAKLSRDSL